MNKYNFINFIEHPEKYSNQKFIDKNKKILKTLNNIKLKKMFI